MYYIRVKDNQRWVCKAAKEIMFKKECAKLIKPSMMYLFEIIKKPSRAYKHVIDIEDLSFSKVLCFLKLNYVRSFFLHQDDVWIISELILWL